MYLLKDFGPLFSVESMYTDDTVMTIAVAEALLDSGNAADVDTIKQYVTEEFGYDLSRTLDDSQHHQNALFRM